MSRDTSWGSWDAGCELFASHNEPNDECQNDFIHLQDIDLKARATGIKAGSWLGPAPTNKTVTQSNAGFSKITFMYKSKLVDRYMQPRVFYAAKIPVMI
jgi:hypothetical protein